MPATQPGALVEKAPAKINLTLHVCGRRDDGYHDLESLVVFAGVHDLLMLEPDAALSIQVSGPTAGAAGPDDENSVIKAAKTLASHVDGLRRSPGQLQAPLDLIMRTPSSRRRKLSPHTWTACALAHFAF